MDVPWEQISGGAELQFQDRLNRYNLVPFLFPSTTTPSSTPASRRDASRWSPAKASSPEKRLRSGWTVSGGNKRKGEGGGQNKGLAPSSLLSSGEKAAVTVDLAYPTTSHTCASLAHHGLRCGRIAREGA